ncbi:DUF350 domain-containing protein [Jiella sp. MQZ9-1]|uniref:DUF350 domain-containing protein n=1 Tax=Jiella flava TaxID=2816857 RepID=A0A939JUG9_9HYPH|nr:DUF350 domain-containing protein [Jiella flava]MBO0663170.1 DUF350 domain-containing protein [Jiella flava]MCD2471588.1 DUF350 domain-containing protein [Jiella flava]
MFGYVAGLPAFLAYFVLGLVLYGLFAWIYTTLTPQKEIQLIRAGNTAAVIAFLGAILGFSLPLASAAANSVSVFDFILWSIIGLLAQLLAFVIASKTMTGLHQRITDGEIAAGLWGGGIALAVGILNAACMTY